MTIAGALTADERYAAAIAALGAGPVRTRRFLEGFAPSDAWLALADGRHPVDPDRRYHTKARPALVDSVAQSCADARVAVRVFGRPGFPDALATDHEAPGVLFTRGDPSVLDTRPRVTVVGTRSATPYGLGVAAELGRALAGAGVVVVSGLSRGIDAAALAGALAVPGGVPPVAVVASAPDAVGHKAEIQLREAIAGRGAVLSERAPGSSGTPLWCFAVRNRMLAALAHVVVVVECHRKGASLTTVKAAADRGVVVTAVPGSVRSSASAGCNALLVDGAAPVRDVEDVLAAVELAVSGRPEIVPPSPPPSSAAKRDPPRPARAPNPTAQRVLRALDHDRASLDTVVRRCGLPLSDVAEGLENLADAGWATGAGGWWSRLRH